MAANAPQTHVLRRQDHPQEYAAFFGDPERVYRTIVDENRARLDAENGGDAPPDPGYRTSDGRAYPFREGNTIVLPRGGGAGLPVQSGASQRYDARFPKPLKVAIKLDIFVNPNRYRRLSGRGAPPKGDPPASVAPSDPHGFKGSRSSASPPEGARVITSERLSPDSEIEITFETPGTRYVDLWANARELTWKSGAGQTQLPLYESLSTTLRVEAKIDQGFISVALSHADEERTIDPGYWLPARVVVVSPFERSFNLSGFLCPRRATWAWLSARREISKGVAEHGRPKDLNDPKDRNSQAYMWTDQTQRAVPTSGKDGRAAEYFKVSKTENNVHTKDHYDREWCGFFQAFHYMNAGMAMEATTRRAMNGGPSELRTIFNSTDKLLIYWGGYIAAPANLLAGGSGDGKREYLMFPTEAQFWARWAALGAGGGSEQDGDASESERAAAKKAPALAALKSDAASRGVFVQWLRRATKAWVTSTLIPWDPRVGDVFVVNAARHKHSHIAMMGDAAPTETNLKITTYEGNHFRRGGAWEWNLIENWDEAKAEIHWNGLFYFYCVGRFPEEEFDREPGSKRRPGYTAAASAFPDPDMSDLHGAVDAVITPEEGKPFSPSASITVTD